MFVTVGFYEGTRPSELPQTCTYLRGGPKHGRLPLAIQALNPEQAPAFAGLPPAQRFDLVLSTWMTLVPYVYITPVMRRLQPTTTKRQTYAAFIRRLLAALCAQMWSKRSVQGQWFLGRVGWGER